MGRLAIRKEKKKNQQHKPTHPIRPMERANTNSPFRYPISTISSISCLVNIPLPARRSKKRDPIAPSTLRTRLFAFERVYVSTWTAYSIYLTEGKCMRANRCRSSTLLSLLSPLLILFNKNAKTRLPFRASWDSWDWGTGNAKIQKIQPLETLFLVSLHTLEKHNYKSTKVPIPVSNTWHTDALLLHGFNKLISCKTLASQGTNTS